MLAERSKVLSMSDLLTWGKMESKPLNLYEDEEESLSQLLSQSRDKSESSSEPLGCRGYSIDPSSACRLDNQVLSALWPSSDNQKAIFLDYDGTLREFEEKPELAVPTPEVQRLLAALNARPDLVVHIISGRDADFLKEHFGMHTRITLIAEHERRVAGRFQIWRPDSHSWSPSSQAWKELIRREVIDCDATMEGCRWEEKATALVWHYRGVSDQVLGDSMAEKLVERLEDLKTLHSLDVKISLGNKIVEISCRSVTKGSVMRRLCEARATIKEPFESVLIAGDDVSDESMFQVAPHNFLTVKVGQADTHARFYVDTPEQLRSILWQLVS